MLNFHIQSDSDVSASKQLFDQIQFAIASGQYAAGHRLPSTRQLAMITGLHRNTISKVYQNLEETGLVESVAGSGIYVKNQAKANLQQGNELVDQPNVQVRAGIDSLLAAGLTLQQIRDLFQEEIDWRIQCNQTIIVTVPQLNLNEGKVMELELTKGLNLAIDLVPLEDLDQLLSKTNFGTIITNRYFLKEVLDVVPPNSFRVIPIDIYDYSKELVIIKKLPLQACLGIVSLSESILEIATSIVSSQRGDELLVLTAAPSNELRLSAVVRTAHTIIVGPSSFELVQDAIAKLKHDLIRIPDIICSDNYVNSKSMNSLRQQLNLGS